MIMPGSQVKIATILTIYSDILITGLFKLAPADIAAKFAIAYSRIEKITRADGPNRQTNPQINFFLLLCLI